MKNFRIVINREKMYVILMWETDKGDYREIKLDIKEYHGFSKVS